MIKLIKVTVVFTFLILGITLSACGRDSTQTEKTSNETSTKQSTSTSNLTYAKITPEDAKSRLDGDEQIILLDVRTQEEYDEKRIPDSILIPVDVIEKEAPSKLTDKAATIFIYCRSGRRSAIASEALVKMGYTDVHDLGGIIDWPYETVSGK